MKRTSRLKKFLASGVILFSISIIFLEIGSRYYKCPITGQYDLHTLVCDPGYYPINQKKVQAIQVLIEMKRQGIEPSRENLEQVINLVKYEEMVGLNGTLCGNGMIFVRDSLGNEGRSYVARHELEHLLVHHRVTIACNNEEQCATLNAAKIYPIGFLETILSSVYISARDSPTVWCFLFGSWRILHANILGW